MPDGKPPPKRPSEHPTASPTVIGIRHAAPLAAILTALIIAMMAMGPQTTTAQAATVDAEQLCQRTPEVRAAILEAIPGVTAVCIDADPAAEPPTEANYETNVTPSQLAGIAKLDLRSRFPAIPFIEEFQPGDFNGLTGLDTIIMVEQPLVAREGLADAGVPLSVLAGLQTLVFANSDLYRMESPDFFKGLSNLRDLNVTTNNMTNELPGNPNRPEGTVVGPLINPEAWRLLPNLRKLSIGSNRILTLPAGFFSHLSNLEELDMFDMWYEYHPYGFGSQALPAGIFAGLTKLRKLDLGYNAIGAIAVDDCLFNGLTALEVLDLRENPLLETLPRSVLGLPEGVRILTDPGVAYPSQHSNRAAAGRPAISGTPRVGETLTASPNEISDTDGMGEAVLAYQWSGDGGSGPAEIPGAAGSSLALTEDQEGKSISVTVSFTDDACNPESLTSEPTEAVKPKPNSPAIGQLTISGTVQVGETIRAEMSAIVDDDGLSNVVFTYQWLADDVEITGATSSTYTPVDTDEGKTIKVIVTFTDDNDNEEALTSEATATVMAAVTPLTAAFQEAPDSHDGSNPFTFSIAFSEDIGINYTTLRDHSLEVDNGSVTQAKRVGGSNKLWEITVEPDSNTAVTVVLPITEDCGAPGAVCTRAGGNERRPLSNRSELTVPGPAAANSPATGVPTISGTVQVGQTLTASTTGIADADGLTNVSFSYQWLANDAEITGATGDTYTLVEADVGKAVKVRVSFTDDDDNEETLTSPATAAVAAETAVPDAPRSLNVSPDDTGTLDVSWEAPASDGGSAITGYKVQWKSGSEDYDGSAGSTRQAEITDPASRTHTIAGLTDGVEYAVRVIAVNDVGDGPPSDEATGTPRETTPPELATATVDGTTLTLTYDEDLDENPEPSPDAFSVTVGGTGRAVDGVSVSGSAVTLTLASAVTPEDTVTVSYTVPTDAAAPRIQDEAGNSAASFSDQDVENNTPPPANTPATGAPSISGTAQVGETLTVDTSAIADADGMSGAVFSYQWLADDADIAGATSDTYTPVADDVGKAIKVRVSFRDDRNHQESLTSEATAADESAVWSATLTVGSYGDFFGYYSFTRTGELSPNEFTLDGTDYTMLTMGDKGTRWFEVTSNVCLPDGFTVRVGETSYEAADAQKMETTILCQYRWTNQPAGLTDGDTVDVEVSFTE